jgi:hypothetical protein
MTVPSTESDPHGWSVGGRKAYPVAIATNLGLRRWPLMGGETMWSKEDGDAMAESVARAARKAARRAAPAVLVLAGILFVAFLVIVVLPNVVLLLKERG